MKVSKVDHTSAGVTSKKDITYNGLLYRNPPKNGVNEILRDAETDEKILMNMKNYIARLNMRASSLYSVFNPINSGKSQKDSFNEKDLYGNISSYFREFVQDIKSSPADTASRNLLNRSGNRINADKNKIDVFVARYLRKSLHKRVKKYGVSYDLSEIIKKIIYLKAGLCRKEDVSEKEVIILAEAVKEDITKERQIEKMAASIVKQDVKIQTYISEDGKILLRHTFAKNSKKSALFRFLLNFTAADPEEQRELIRELRELVVRFYSANKTGKKAEDNGGGEETSDKEEIFCNRAGTLLTELQAELQRLEAEKKGSNEKSEITDLYKEKVKKAIRYDIAGSYQKAVAEIQKTGGIEDSVFWLGIIKKYAEKILLSDRRFMDQGIQNREFLCKRTMQMLISYIAMKLVDLGKAVYHFTMPAQIDVTNGKAVRFGEVLPSFRNGITSFDYEWIKAEESLTRELSTYSVFAVRNFLNSISKKESDIIAVNPDKVKGEILKPNAAMRALRYFGGKKEWQETYIEEVSENELINALRKEIGAARNSTFHYAGTIDNGITDDDKLIISQIYEKEHGDIGKIRRKKYYSNNVLMFYKKADIDALMDYLYSAPKDHPAQIPAFNKILNKNKVYEFSKFIKGNPKKKISTAGKTEELKGCVFYMLKECYYYGFLPDSRSVLFVREALEDIVKSAEEADPGATDRKPEAAQNFKKRYDEISENASLGQICQRIMTDFQLQNSGQKKAKSSKYAQKGVGESIYQHFPMILYDILRKAFWKYLNVLTETGEMNFMFMREPSYKPEFAAEEEFCKNWNDHSYDDIREGMEEDSYLEAWFTAAHFIAPAQLNHLIGSFKKYEQFTSDIKFRAEGNGIDCSSRWQNRIQEDERHRLLRVLEFVQMANGTFSKEISDYYGSDEDSAIEEYAEFVENFVEFSTKKMPNKHVALQTFCNTAVKNGSPNGRIGIYYDGEKPILNRNIVMADMYGNVSLISNCMKKVTEREIKVFYNDMNNLTEVFKRGFCQNEDEQKRLKAFQNNKNRVELLDVAIYTEIVNELYAQLVSWAYLRERDLMYYQLGFYYMKLFYGNSVPEDSFLRIIQGNGVNITEGAVLYQLTATYSFGWPLLGRDGNVDEKAITTGNKISSFAADYCSGDESIYESCLILFERPQSHDAIIAVIRNPIDHMHYFEKGKKGAARSILEMYSDIYDLFFDYDLKLKKSVSFVLQNILLDHFIIAHTVMNRQEKKYIYIEKDGKKECCTGSKLKAKEDKENKEKSYTGTKLEIRPNREQNKKVFDKTIRKMKEISIIHYGMESDILTYKIKENGKPKPVIADARSRMFLDQMQRILEYSKT